MRDENSTTYSRTLEIRVSCHDVSPTYQVSDIQCYPLIGGGITTVCVDWNLVVHENGNRKELKSEIILYAVLSCYRY